MFDIFKKEINKSDKVKLYLTSGKEVDVDIVEIGDKHILVKNADGSQSRFFEQLIGGWDLLSSDKTRNVQVNAIIENENINTESEHKPVENNENKISLKIIGKIDLGKFQPKQKKQVEPKSSIPPVSNIGKKPQTLSQHIREYNLVFTSLQSLQDLKDKFTLNIAQQTIPANAILKNYFAYNQYGYVTDNEGKDYKFYLSDVSDDILKGVLSRPNQRGIHLVCSLKSTQGRLRATSIFLPKTVSELQALAEIYYHKKELIESRAILNLIINSVDDFEPALNLKNKIFAEQNKRSYTSTVAASIYLQAKTEIKRGNVEYAKKLLLELIENPNSKSETALKELSYELQREGKLDDAIKLVSENQNLIKTSDPNSLLAYFYETKKDFETAISYLQKINPQTALEKIRVNKRLAFDFFQTKDYASSESYLRKVIEKQPEDVIIQKLLDALEKIKLDGLSDEIETIFNEAELSSLTGGRSPHILFALTNCDFTGVPASIVSEEKFTKTTLQALRRLIEDAGKARPRERAQYLLTEAKLIEILEIESENEFNTVLTRYCLAMGQNVSSENSPVDIVRFYLLEAFRLAKSFDTISGFVPIYLYSFKYSSFESYQNLSKALDSTLKDFFECEMNNGFWYGLIDLFLTNTEIFSQLLTRLYQNQSYRASCLVFLSDYLKVNSTNNPNKEVFSSFWNKAVDKRRREIEAFNSKFISLSKNKTTESYSEAFESAKQMIPSWIGNLDIHRINFVEDILRTLSEFNSQAAFEDKERYFNIIGSQINALQTEIEGSPTEFSFNILRIQLAILNKLLDWEFKTVIQTSKPLISIKVLGESIIHDNNDVIASINVSNKKGSAPISWFSVDINKTEDVEFNQENNESNQSLKGGDDKTFKIKLQVSQHLREQEAFNLNVKFTYKIRGGEDVISFSENLAIRLYSETEFDVIPNPFAATADSGPVQDEKMFFGRNNFIENIKKSVLESSSKCVIIYGQKRSGKSSVLFHLKKQLNNSSKAFCISFSLGEIVDDLSAQTFYYKVLSEIEDSLENQPNDMQPIPKFVAPTLAELREAPSLIFNDYMKKFRKECLLTAGWENRNPVLLIDEFTYIYTAIQKNFLSDQFMKTWKSFVEKGYFTSILIGQDIMPKFKMAYQNEFGIAEDKRLSYLSKEDAVKLAVEPIWDNKRDRSRYLGTALDLILDYTSSNPYYIQIFCARLVTYMNSQKAISVTEADVYEVAQTFIKGEQSLSADKFDNLITAGDADIESFNPQDILKALKEIAFASKNLDSCSRDSIRLGDKEKEDLILSDLKTREVISCPQPDFYKIKVRLFKEWLLNN